MSQSEHGLDPLSCPHFIVYHLQFVSALFIEVIKERAWIPAKCSLQIVMSDRFRVQSQVINEKLNQVRSWDKNNHERNKEKLLRIWPWKKVQCRDRSKSLQETITDDIITQPIFPLCPKGCKGSSNVFSVQTHYT